MTGSKARTIGIVGKWFPTGAHKVGPAISCLLPELLTGRFDPTTQKAVWPSTENYCRGGAYTSKLLSCPSVSILPEGMSKERFAWLRTMAEGMIATPACESNVKEIFDKCIELEHTRPDAVIFNQFDQLPNSLWHYNVTGPAMEEVFRKIGRPGDKLAGAILSSGSAGTMSAGSYLRETDAAIGVDDELTIRFMRLFNEPAGRKVLSENGVSEDTLDKLELIGISSIGSMISAIKMAKYYEFDENDNVFTVFTDSMPMYQSRLSELDVERGGSIISGRLIAITTGSQGFLWTMFLSFLKSTSGACTSSNISLGLNSLESRSKNFASNGTTTRITGVVCVLRPKIWMR